MNSKKLTKIIADDKRYLFQNYGDRLPVCFVKGRGACLYDQDNRRYIDFFSGIAVTALGHAHGSISRALHAQVDRLLHTSNWYYNREQIEAARMISDMAFPGKTLFVNSGTEANEAAIKLARRYGLSISPERYRIISFESSFHGRTFGGMSATAQEKIRKGFGPLVPGFHYLPFNDAASFAKEVRGNPNICAVITELIQGEGGIRLADRNFILQLSDICRKNNILVIIDEIQTGIGRTGSFCAYQHFGIVPDIITLAKGLGGGVPIGAIHARADLAACFERGSHGTTFGGNHLACAAAVAVLRELSRGKVFLNVEKINALIMKRLHEIKKRVSFIREIRGLGLHLGVELTRPGSPLVEKALARGLVINCTSEKVIRVTPPLNISLKEAREGLDLLEHIFLEEEAQH